MDDDSRIDYAAPPPLPAAPAQSNKAVWWILGGAAAIVVLSNLFWLWFFFSYVWSDGPFSGPFADRGGPGTDRPVNRQPVDKEATADAAAYEAQVDGYLADLAARYADSGYTETHTSGKVALAGGGADYVEIDLAADLQHVVFAVCDDDCTDLDLTLFDENDNVIDEDYAVDSEPVVEVVPAWSGRFGINVEMVDCLADDCLYALAVYSRPEPEPGALGGNPKSEP